jgi:hypothetical protein
MGKRLLLALMLLLPLLAAAQAPEQAPRAGLAFGMQAHSFGFGIDVRYLMPRGRWDYDLAVSLSSYKSPQEARIESAYADQGGKDYVYDKLNYCYMLSPSVGMWRKVIGANSYNKVSLSVGASAGPLLAILKPYFVEVPVPFSGNQALVEAYRYDPTLYNYSNIYGAADYFLGMNEMTVLPGARAKVAALVNLSANSTYIRALEVGLFADAFSKRLPLLGARENKQAFIGGSVEILIGDSW